GTDLPTHNTADINTDTNPSRVLAPVLGTLLPVLVLVLVVIIYKLYRKRMRKYITERRIKRRRLRPFTSLFTSENVGTVELVDIMDRTTPEVEVEMSEISEIPGPSSGSAETLDTTDVIISLEPTTTSTTTTTTTTTTAAGESMSKRLRSKELKSVFGSSGKRK
ncbi:MAG: hypothetical protein NZ811_06740, partial [Gammaproteobacteria bacterium]|nr:hypothetical protein [Gammaproteobacteria bacterium]